MSVLQHQLLPRVKFSVEVQQLLHQPHLRAEPSLATPNSRRPPTLFWYRSPLSEVGFDPVSCACCWWCHEGPDKPSAADEAFLLTVYVDPRRGQSAEAALTTLKQRQRGCVGSLAVLWPSAPSQEGTLQASIPTSKGGQLEKSWCRCKHPSLQVIYFLFSTSVLTFTGKAGRLSVWGAHNWQWFPQPALLSFTFQLRVQPSAFTAAASGHRAETGTGESFATTLLDGAGGTDGGP